MRSFGLKSWWSMEARDEDKEEDEDDLALFLAAAVDS